MDHDGKCPCCSYYCLSFRLFFSFPFVSLFPFHENVSANFKFFDLLKGETNMRRSPNGSTKEVFFSKENVTRLYRAFFIKGTLPSSSM